MAKNFIQPGDVLTIPAPADVLSGEVVIAGAFHGVALETALSGAKVDVNLKGVWSIAKVSANAFSVGAAIYYDSAAKLATSTSSGNTLIGYATEAAGNGAATVAVRLAN